MIGYRLDRAKGLFFDAPRVRHAVGRAERQVLGRFGAYVRRSARRSIRKRKRVSRPGQPPSSHTGTLRRLILFGYQPERHSVVIGPVRLNAKIGNATEALEKGGRSRIAYGPRRDRKRKAVRIAPRPFMRPALVQEEPKLMPMWRDSIRRS
jgi:hypothetical protein